MEKIHQANLSLQTPLKTLSHPDSKLTNDALKATKRLSDYRLVMGWVMLGFWIASSLGLDWDVQWHADVGRDGFWTPPHWMFYSTITVSGLICAVVVLTETFLYYRRNPAITDRTTTPVLFFFRGPVGFELAGFGMLVMLISAPFDDYWHRIFGVDLAIWTPFHVMLLIGVVMANIGIVYLFASEYNRHNQIEAITNLQNKFVISFSSLKTLFAPATLGLLVASITLLTRFILLMDETFVGANGPGTLTVGDWHLPSYSLMVAGLPLVLVALELFTGRIGTATLAGFLFLFLRLGSVAFTNWGIHTLAAERGVPVRSGGASSLGLITFAYPFFFWLAGLIVDAVFLFLTKSPINKYKRVTFFAALISSVLAGLALFLLEKPWISYNDVIGKLAANTNGFGAYFVRQRLFFPDYWQALPFVFIISVLAGITAIAVSTSLRYTDH